MRRKGMNAGFTLVELLVVRKGAFNGSAAAHEFLKFGKVLPVDCTRQDAVFVADGSCKAYDLASHAAGSHDTCGSKGHMGNRDVTPRHEEVVYVSGI